MNNSHPISFETLTAILSEILTSANGYYAEAKRNEDLTTLNLLNNMIDNS
jgi:hypothetical protein